MERTKSIWPVDTEDPLGRCTGQSQAVAGLQCCGLEASLPALASPSQREVDHNWKFVFASPHRGHISISRNPTKYGGASFLGRCSLFLVVAEVRHKSGHIMRVELADLAQWF